MNYILIGNIVAFIASILMVYSGIIKDKKKIVFIQTIQIGLFVLSNLILGGITGAITNIICCIRNILCYKNKLNFKEKTILTITLIVISLKFNNLGLLGFLPVISNIIYMWNMNTKNIINFKLLNIFSTTTWLVYDLSISSYTSSLFNVANIIANTISIYDLKKNKKRGRKNEI